MIDRGKVQTPCLTSLKWKGALFFRLFPPLIPFVSQSCWERERVGWSPESKSPQPRHTGLVRAESLISLCWNALSGRSQALLRANFIPAGPDAFTRRFLRTLMIKWKPPLGSWTASPAGSTHPPPPANFLQSRLPLQPTQVLAWACPTPLRR